ncbi:MAG: TonB-dependent receptor [Acidobacteria bacterium]|nr:TonB-dependent receptor [Acidobacteriota bacterium]
MKERIGLLCAAFAALALILFSPLAAAQDFRGTIKGEVTDATGGVLPGVSITVTNVETNVASTTITDSKGFYQVSHLISGTYSVEAKLEGLKTVVRPNIAVRVGDAIDIDFKMESGDLKEVMTVTAAAPILDTSSPTTGTVIDSNQIARLPLGDGTAYMLSRLAPGVSDSSDLHFSRPMDNGNLAGVVSNGAMGGNEFTLDGAPNRVSPNSTSPGNNNGVVGFSPPSDAIAEFKVQTNAFDAQSGHTAGATVNLALKSGTNNFQGSASYFNRSDSRSATPLLTKRAGGEKPTRKYDRMTATFSGPVIQDRTFFMMSVEHLKDVQPEPATYTVPTLKMRQGDFSEFPNVTIYDPLTATGSALTRTAFAGNQIPASRINRVARAFAALYPEPNRPGTAANYFTNQLRPYDYDAVLGRIDHNFNGSNRLFVNGYWNKRQEDRYNWALGAPNADGGAIDGVEVTHGFDYRSNKGMTLGFTSVQQSSLVFDVRGAWSQFGEWRQSGADFDPASLGFSPEAVKLMEGYNYLPFITFGGFSTTNSNSTLASLGAQRSDFGTGFSRPFTNISFIPTADWLWRGQSMRAGYELRSQRWDIDNAAYGAGRYHFNGAYTRLNNSAPLNDIAQSWAQFLLGLPTVGTNTVASAGATSSQFEIAADGDYRQVTHALFLQDDWHVNNNLTVNLGLRLEYDQAMREADDRNLAGFNKGVASPIEAAAQAKYAANPIAEIPASAFAVKGGLEFADGPLYNNLTKLMPRGAFSYLLGQKTVLRGGVGLFSYDYYFDAGNQTGFSQPTPIVTTDNNGATFLTDLSNPIPSGQLVQPAGASRGYATGLGLTLGTIVPSEREVPYYTRWQIGAQRDIGAGFVVEVFYVGSRGKHLPVARELNGIPIQYLSSSRTRDTAQEAFLSQAVPNPFAGLLPGTTINGTTIARSQLLRPYPQFLGGAANGAVSGTGTLSVGTEEYVGSDKYDAGSIRIEKRFSGGNSVIATYTRSKLTDKLNYLNPGNGILEERTSPNDRPNRATLGGTMELPFGHGRKFGSDWRGFTQAALGGWTVSATYQYQSGFPLVWNNNIYYDPDRDPRDLHSYIGKHLACGTAGLDCPAWDTSGFYIPGGTGRTDARIQLGNNIRYFPSTLPNVRTDDLHLMDIGIYKSFALPWNMSLQARIEIINALNYTVLWNPNQDPRNASFGLVNQDRNNPRDIQIGAKLSF